MLLSEHTLKTRYFDLRGRNKGAKNVYNLYQLIGAQSERLFNYKPKYLELSHYSMGASVIMKKANSVCESRQIDIKISKNDIKKFKWYFRPTYFRRQKITEHADVIFEAIFACIQTLLNNGINVYEEVGFEHPQGNSIADQLVMDMTRRDTSHQALRAETVGRIRHIDKSYSALLRTP